MIDGWNCEGQAGNQKRIGGRAADGKKETHSRSNWILLGA